MKIENKQSTPKVFTDWKAAFSNMPLANEMTISFHHHLRNGDAIVNRVMSQLDRLGLKQLKLAPSAIFPAHDGIVDLIKRGTVRSIHTAYANGPVAQVISQGYCEEVCTFTTHGGRPRAILTGELPINVAYIAAPTVDCRGNISGQMGKSACGSLGYAIADAEMADYVVAITDNLIDEELPVFDIPGNQVDMVILVNSLGDSRGIVSGTTQLTKDPVGWIIADRCIELLKSVDMLRNDMSFQMGAGGISLAVANRLRLLMKHQKLQGRFASGGIMAEHVAMLNQGLVRDLYDVQCFDTVAVESIRKNPNHHSISASRYANPTEPNNIANQLDFVILGASEVDQSFNVNVTTGSNGVIIGGSGGHADTANGAKLSIIVSKLVNARVPVVVDQVDTISTPGQCIDVLITDYGVAVNPNSSMAARLHQTKLPLLPIEELKQVSDRLTGIPRTVKRANQVVAISQDPFGRQIDQILKLG